MTEEREGYTARKGSKLLLDEHPLIVLPSLAVAVGLHEAIILQQIHYWLQADHCQVRDGYSWVYNSYTSWKLQLPFLSEGQIKRAIWELEERGILISANYNTMKMDKTKWYRIDYDAIPDQPSVASDQPSVASDQAKDAGDQPIPETTTEITTEREEEDKGLTHSVFSSLLTHCARNNIRPNASEQSDALVLLTEIEQAVGPLRAEKIINRATLHVGALKYPTWPALAKVLRHSFTKESRNVGLE